MLLTSIQLPGAQTNFSCSQHVSMPEPATAIKPINPSTEDDYDWFGRQTINLYLFHSPLTPFLLWMNQISWKSVSSYSFTTVR